jgi:hypothetical protein
MDEGDGCMSVVIEFLAGRGADSEGRMIGAIQGKPEIWLESRHDFIQWLFPLPEPSGANPDAPLLTQADALTVAGDEGLKATLLASVDAMARLYGLSRSGPTFARGPAFPGPFRDWLGPIDHNHLRLTRILRCLSLCGLIETAGGLRRLLEEIAAVEALGAWGLSLKYWRDAGAWPAHWTAPGG